MICNSYILNCQRDPEGILLWCFPDSWSLIFHFPCLGTQRFIWYRPWPVHLVSLNHGYFRSLSFHGSFAELYALYIYIFYIYIYIYLYIFIYLFIYIYIYIYININIIIYIFIAFISITPIRRQKSNLNLIMIIQASWALIKQNNNSMIIKWGCPKLGVTR